MNALISWLFPTTVVNNIALRAEIERLKDEVRREHDTAFNDRKQYQAWITDLRSQRDQAVRQLRDYGYAAPLRVAGGRDVP